MCDFPLPGGSEISQDLTCLCCRFLGGCSREGHRPAQRLLFHWVACFCCFTNAALLARGQGQSNEKIVRRGRQCLICFSDHSWPNSRWPAADKNGSQRKFFGHCSWPSPQPDCPLTKRIFWGMFAYQIQIKGLGRYNYATARCFAKDSKTHTWFDYRMVTLVDVHIFCWSNPHARELSRHFSWVKNQSSHCNQSWQWWQWKIIYVLMTFPLMSDNTKG